MILHASSSQREKIENWKIHTRIEIVLPDFYNRNPVFFFFRFESGTFVEYFDSVAGKKWRRAAETRVLESYWPMSRSSSSISSCCWRRARVSISSIAYVLKPVSFEMISRYPDDIFSRYYCYLFKCVVGVSSSSSSLVSFLRVRVPNELKQHTTW
jgi:hypothetical protein